MIAKAKQTEEVWIYSMGKRFRLMAVADSDDEANRYMAAHDEAAVIACLGGLVFMASKYPNRQAATWLALEPEEKAP